MISRRLALDMHKNYLYAYVEETGAKPQRFRCPNGRAHWDQLARQWVDSHTQVIVEATGSAFALYDTLALARV